MSRSSNSADKQSAIPVPLLTVVISMFNACGLIDPTNIPSNVCDASKSRHKPNVRFRRQSRLWVATARGGAPHINLEGAFVRPIYESFRNEPSHPIGALSVFADEDFLALLSNPVEDNLGRIRCR